MTVVHGRFGLQSPEAISAVTGKTVEQVMQEQAVAAQAKAWNILGAKALAKPLPPIPWLCEPLKIAPGAVTLVAGYGYSRKTMALQSLAMSVVSGKAVWGLHSVRKGRVVHLDYEQGERLDMERYQRLARGMGFDLADLDDDVLRVACMPRMYLETQEAIDSLMPFVDGAALVIVDSMRAAFPHADENSSEVRSYLDALTRLSERTGACIIVIHHARKPNATNGGTATHAIRGSSALFDACQTVYVFEGEKGTPTTIHMEKDRITGSDPPDFGVTSIDVPGANEPRWGLEVRHLDHQQMTSRSVAEVRFEGMKAEIVKLLERKRKNDLRSMTAIHERVGGRKQACFAAIRELMEEEFIIQVGGTDGPFKRVESRFRNGSGKDGKDD